MIGIKAIAKIMTSEDGENWHINKISSGGLWGIETDSEESYKEDEEKNQLSELKDILLTLGFTKEEIETAEVIIKK